MYLQSNTECCSLFTVYFKIILKIIKIKITIIIIIIIPRKQTRIFVRRKMRSERQRAASRWLNTLHILGLNKLTI